MVTVMNLRTGDTQGYTCTPREAVVAAFAQSHKDWNTWQYKDRYDAYVVEGEMTIACADFCAFKDGRNFEQNYFL